jgi:hypothetical protein
MRIEIVALLVVVFIAGFGWGRWWSERTIRAEQLALNSGRLTVSMPMDKDKDKASDTLGLLRDLVQMVENEKAKP